MGVYSPQFRQHACNPPSALQFKPFTPIQSQSPSKQAKHRRPSLQLKASQLEDARRQSQSHYRVRQAKESESPQVAKLCAEVFGPMAFQAFPAFLTIPHSVRQEAVLQIFEDVNFQLRKALQTKRKATREAREFKLARMSAALRSELAQLSGSAPAQSIPRALKKQALKRWTRNRQFICLVAETLNGTLNADSSLASSQAAQNQDTQSPPHTTNGWAANPRVHQPTTSVTCGEHRTPEEQKGTTQAAPLLDHQAGNKAVLRSGLDLEQHGAPSQNGSLSGSSKAEGGQGMLQRGDGGRDSEVVGCAVLSILAPEALLPPPFPSTAPTRCCISNLATSPAHRKKGVATMLVHRCESIARRWGFKDIWLQTDVSNTAAQAVYKAIGFLEYKRDPPYLGPFRRILLRKELMPLPSGESQSETRLEESSNSKGTYQWTVSRK